MDASFPSYQIHFRYRNKLDFLLVAQSGIHLIAVFFFNYKCRKHSRFVSEFTNINKQLLQVLTVKNCSINVKFFIPFNEHNFYKC